MLNLFGAIANGLGRMLPGYMNGYQMAIKDNWNDLNQYNQVQQGQLGNMWLESSFDPMYNQLLYNTAMTQLNAQNMKRQSDVNAVVQPGLLARAGILSSNAANVANAQQQNVLDDLLYQQANRHQMFDWNRQLLNGTNPVPTQQSLPTFTIPTIPNPPAMNYEDQARRGLPSAVTR